VSQVILNPQQVKEVQAALKAILEDQSLKIDGIYGRQTAEAVRKFQALAKQKGAYSGEVDGKLNRDTLNLIRATAGLGSALDLNRQQIAQQYLEGTGATTAPQGENALQVRSEPTTDSARGVEGVTNFTSPAKTKELQQELNRIRAQYGIRSMPALEVDGKYGPKTREAVREFQKFLRDTGFASKNQSEFPIDGIWGPKTQAAYEKFLARDNPSRQPNASQRVDAGLSIPDASTILSNYSNGNFKIDLPLSPGDKFSVKDAAFFKLQLEKAIEMEQDEMIRQRLENTKNIFDQVLEKYGNKPDKEFVVKVHHPTAARRIIPV